MNKGIPFPKVFEVIDKQTGKVADIQQIIKEEEWAQRLVRSEMLGFLISEDGTLYLADTCGNFIACSCERFKIVFTESWREWWLLNDYQRKRYPGDFTTIYQEYKENKK